MPASPSRSRQSPPGGRSCATGRRRRYARWFDIDWDSRDNPGKSWSRCSGSRRRVPRRRRARRSRATGCAITTMSCRWPTGTADAARWPSCWPPSIGGCATGGWAARSSTTGASSTSRPWPACGWRIRTSSTRPTASPRLGRRRDGGTACASIIPTVCRPAGLPRPAVGGDPRMLDRRGEDPRGRRAAARRLGVPRHYGLRRPQQDHRASSSTRAGEEPLTRLYDEITGADHRWPTAAKPPSARSLSTVLAAELNRLTELAAGAAWARPALPRSHPAGPAGGTRGAADPVRRLSRLPARRRAPRPPVPASHRPRGAARHQRPARPCRDIDGDRRSRPVAGPRSWSSRFAQTCGPVMAKGVEDTAFYRYGRLLALNEVGGDPCRFGLPIGDFHAWAAAAPPLAADHDDAVHA